MSTVATFAVVAAVMAISPGLDTLLVLNAGMRHGRSTALRTALGIICGLLAWGFLVAAGVAALILAVPVAATLLRLAGAGYLAWLGLQSLRGGFRAKPLVGDESSSGRSGFLTGIVANLLNPKVGLFYLSLLPQFVGFTGSITLDTITLAGIHAGESLIWLTAVALGAARYRRLLAKPRFARGIQLAFGACLVALAGQLVAS